MKSLTKKLGSLLFISLIVVLAACGSDEKDASSPLNGGKINVVTTISQIGEPLAAIGGDRVNVESLMGPSVDPHLYHATQSDIKKIDRADIIFYNGLNLEANLVEIFKKISQSKPVLAVGDTVPADLLLKDEGGAVDPHIWFDLDLWEKALEAAVEELKNYSPEDADYFEENKQKYFAEIAKVKQETKKLADIPKDKRILVTAHDAFGYFGRMHDIKVVGLQGLSTDAEIGVSDINETINIIKEHRVPAIFIESSINDSSIKAVIEGAKNEGIDVKLGGELFSDAMGEPGTEEGTYLGMYRHNVDTIYKALSGGAE